jgi:CMP-N-acetylneuraminic acid synthetase
MRQMQMTLYLCRQHLSRVEPVEKHYRNLPRSQLLPSCYADAGMIVALEAACFILRPSGAYEENLDAQTAFFDA